MPDESKPEQTEQAAAPKTAKKGSLAALIVRIVLIVLLVIVVITTFRWHGLRGEYNEAIELYNQERYQEAYDKFDAVQKRTLAAVRIRKAALAQMEKCRPHLSGGD